MWVKGDGKSFASSKSTEARTKSSARPPLSTKARHAWFGQWPSIRIIFPESPWMIVRLSRKDSTGFM